MTAPFRKFLGSVDFFFSPRTTCYLPCVPLGAPLELITSVRLGTYWPLDRYPDPLSRDDSEGGDKGKAQRRRVSGLCWSVCVSLFS